MILVTVGMQLGFDRLIQAMDALQPGIGIEMVAQIGRGHYVPECMTSQRQFKPEEFDALGSRAALIVSHAGVGSVLAAKRARKPIVLLPRRVQLGEHRNDHQLATARHLAGRSGIFVAMEESDLPGAVAQGLACGPIADEPSPSIGNLHSAISRFVKMGTLR